MRQAYEVIHDDARAALRRLRVRADLIVTSPPYADARKRHYDSINPDDYAAWFASFNDELVGALKPEGSLVVNIKDKVVNGVRHRYVWETVMALERLGWYAIDDYIWHKPNAMPGYWPNRLRDAWEYCFHLSRTKRPYIDFEAVKRPIGGLGDEPPSASRSQRHEPTELGQCQRLWPQHLALGRAQHRPADNVLSLPLVGKNKGHPAVFPVELPAFFIRLLTPKDGLVIDPFGGSGTTAVAAFQEGRSCILIDNNPRYCRQARERLMRECGLDISAASSSGKKRSSVRQIETWSAVAGRQARRLAA